MGQEEADPREHVMACKGHALVIGGPGSGKTTLALKKALARIREGVVPGQTVLFLSFSRAAVTRVLDAAKVVVPRSELSLLSVQTFHSFFWELLKAHAYLTGAPRKLAILLPQDEKALSGGIDEDDDGWSAWLAERDRLFREEGRVAFDLFASNAAKLLEQSAHILNNIALSYPLIIVDEAQDTGANAWRCIELLSSHTQVICLADLEQQIFDFLPGVGPERIKEIRAALAPLDVDLGNDNHRSPDTEILAFGNDILTAKPRSGPYKGVSSIAYGVGRNAPNWNHLLRRALSVLHRHMRADGKGSAKSAAILTMGKGGALKVSNALNALGSNQGKVVRHKLLFDEAEALLTARFAAFLLEPKQETATDLDIATCMELLATARRATGTGKAAVNKLLEQAAKIRAEKVLTINLVKALRSVMVRIREEGFAGDPAADWLFVKHTLRATGQAELMRAAAQLDFLVAFQRGHRISAALSDEWLRDGAYTRARLALDSALAQEQILDGVEEPPGLQVMNIHKAKGKQFDGVILVRELRHTGNNAESSFVWRGDEAPYPKSRRLVRVGVTRARRQLLILNPVWPACPLLRGHQL
ncbi:UvrD-helicase domain-containing protein [Ralstonia soli]|uniref:DNA 3'-5' helicase II n=1 Tax=Ralstonia soli TaxID=2953896 RepID=A0ABT1AMY7_9RALS|nr:ATP-dependent helicase [Ralstonia soli]MCO5399750.1 ATP-dependent helicase [Ralstonia soli]